MTDQVPANEEQRLLAADPETPLAILAELAYGYPELRPIIATNPSSYPGLLDWLAQLGDPEVTRALAARAGALDGATVPVTVPEPVDSAPATETAPLVEAAPVAEVASVAEAAPVIGDAPVADTPPAAAPFSFATFIKRPRAWIAAGAAAVVIVLVVVIASVSAANSRAEQEAAAQREASQQQEAVAKASPPPSPKPSPSLSPTPTPTPPAPVAVAPQPVGPTWTFANKAGFSYDMTMSVGAATRYSKESPPSFAQGTTAQKAGTACVVDPLKDVVIPVTWSAKATTQNFKTKVSMRAIFRPFNQKYAGSGIAPFDRDSRVMVEQFFSSGPKCSTFSSTNLWGYGQVGGFSVQFQDELAAGASVRTRFFVIVKNYYTPATPTGDTALLDWITIRPIFGGDNSDDANVYREANANLGVYSLTGITLNGATVTGK